MKNIDKGTLIRTALLVLAFINQGLVLFGKDKLPFTNDQITHFFDFGYQVSTFVFTVVMAAITYYKHNFITNKGGLQKKALQAQGLLKK
jgi:SPP1 family holin